MSVTPKGVPGLFGAKMAAIVFDGYHNGHGFETLYLRTPAGGLQVDMDGDVKILDDNLEDLEPNVAAERVWRQLLKDGVDDDGRAMTLFVDDGPERLQRISDILAAAGLPPPHLLDIEDGALSGKRWTPPRRTEVYTINNRLLDLGMPSWVGLTVFDQVNPDTCKVRTCGANPTDVEVDEVRPINGGKHTMVTIEVAPPPSDKPLAVAVEW